jgi:hypothetical protein
MAKCRLTARTATHANRPQCKAVHSSAESPRKRSIGYVGFRHRQVSSAAPSGFGQV